jgi:hypothetical protein
MFGYYGVESLNMMFCDYNTERSQKHQVPSFQKSWRKKLGTWCFWLLSVLCHKTCFWARRLPSHLLCRPATNMQNVVIFETCPGVWGEPRTRGGLSCLRHSRYMIHKGFNDCQISLRIASCINIINTFLYWALLTLQRHVGSCSSALYKAYLRYYRFTSLQVTPSVKTCDC